MSDRLFFRCALPANIRPRSLTRSLRRSPSRSHSGRKFFERDQKRKLLRRQRKEWKRKEGRDSRAAGAPEGGEAEEGGREGAKLEERMEMEHASSTREPAGGRRAPCPKAAASKFPYPKRNRNCSGSLGKPSSGSSSAVRRHSAHTYSLDRPLVHMPQKSIRRGKAWKSSYKFGDVPL